MPLWDRILEQGSGNRTEKRLPDFPVYGDWAGADCHVPVCAVPGALVSRLFFHEEEAFPVMMGYLVIVGLSEPFMAVELMSEGAIAGLWQDKDSAGVISVTLTAASDPAGTGAGAYIAWPGRYLVGAYADKYAQRRGVLFYISQTVYIRCEIDARWLPPCK